MTIELSGTASGRVLVIADDGRGGEAPEGSGLTGMRERVASMGGTLVRDGAAGTRITVILPEAPADASIASA